MSYVPPHLRNSSSTTTTTTTTRTSSGTLDTDRSNLSYSSNSHFNNDNSSAASFSSFSQSNASRWSSGTISSANRAVAVPDAVVPQWKPSERVLRMKPEQVRILIRLPLRFSLTSCCSFGFRIWMAEFISLGFYIFYLHWSLLSFSVYLYHHHRHRVFCGRILSCRKLSVYHKRYEINILFVIHIFVIFQLMLVLVSDAHSYAYLLLGGVW